MNKCEKSEKLMIERNKLAIMHVLLLYLLNILIFLENEIMAMVEETETYPHISFSGLNNGFVKPNLLSGSVSPWEAESPN